MTGVAAPVLLLDGASMWFRAYFGVPSSLTAPDGRPVNAVRGFLDSVAALIDRQRPRRLVVCLDLDWRPRFRVAHVPSYKAHRVAAARAGDDDVDIEIAPDELVAQIDMIAELLDALGVATGGAPGFEADDVVASLAAAERRDPVVAVTGDRDLFQVVADAPVPVRVLYLGRGLSKAPMLGPAEVAEEYRVPAARAGAAYAELALLRGDPSDGLPGVPGIGEKTAAALLTEHGSLDAIMAAAAGCSSMPQRTAARLRAAADYIAAAGPVVRVVTDAPVTLSTSSDTLPGTPADSARLSKLAARLGIGASIERLHAALSAAAAPT